MRQRGFTTEDTESTEEEKANKDFLALDRRNPPFIPQRTRDGGETPKTQRMGHPQVHKWVA